MVDKENTRAQWLAYFPAGPELMCSNSHQSHTFFFQLNWVPMSSQQKWVHGDYFGNKGDRRDIDQVKHQLPNNLEKVETLASVRSN